MPERTYSLYQVADLLGSTTAEVSGWIRQGWLSAERAPEGAVRVTEQALARFFRERGIDLESLLPEAAASQGPEREAQQDLHEGEVVSVSALGPPQPAEPSADRPDDPGKESKPADPAACAAAAERVAQAVLEDALARSASHIHLELGPGGLSLRMRIDGAMHERPGFRRRLPRALAPMVAGRFLELAGGGSILGPRPFLGSFTQRVGEKEVVFDLSAFPTLQGQKLVLAVHQRRRALPELAELGLSGAEESLIRRMLAQPAGLVLVAGPPRSGITTTLLAMLAASAAPDHNVVVIEDSLDPQTEGLVQSHATAGFTFADGVRAFAAQDADVVVVGQLREPALARAAVEAAAGRLVLAGLCAPGAASSAGKMLAMDIQLGLFSAVLLGIVAQRLLRLLCGECKSPQVPSDELLEQLGLRREEVGAKVFAAGGCPRCLGSGYLGRTGVFSVLAMDQAFAALLRGGADQTALERAALRHGMRSLPQAAAEKVRAGLTSLEEIARVLSYKA